MSSDNTRFMKEALAAEKRKKMRAYEWCRLRNEFPDMPIWRAVARKSGVHLTSVIAMVIKLDALANKSKPRGCVADMSIPEFAASLDLSPTAIARIRSALEEPDIAWIDQDHVVDFHQRNPDHEDSTAADRQRRRRAKLKEQREAAMAQPPPGYPQSRVTSRDVTRDTVTVTPRPDQILKTAPDENLARAGPMAAAVVSMSQFAEAIVDAEQAEQWLAGFGRALVSERMQIPNGMAETTIARWLRELGGDLVQLVAIIQATSATADPERSSHFMIMVTDQIKRHQQAGRGQQLPFPPVVIKRSENG